MRNQFQLQLQLLQLQHFACKLLFCIAHFSLVFPFICPFRPHLCVCACDAVWNVVFRALCCHISGKFTCNLIRLACVGNCVAFGCRAAREKEKIVANEIIVNRICQSRHTQSVYGSTIAKCFAVAGRGKISLKVAFPRTGKGTLHTGSK